MVTITKPTPEEPNVRVEPDEISLAPENTEDITEAVERLVEGLFDGTVATEKVKFPVRIARRISAFYDRLSGSPFTQQDRMRATLADIENRRCVSNIVA